MKSTPVAEAARPAGRDVVECPNINADEAVAQIRQRKPDVILVVDFGQLIHQSVMDSARLGAVNVHASLLPELRGAAPVQWAIIRGCQRTGVTSFQIVKAMDAGPIFLQKATDIGPDETAEQLRVRLAAMGALLACETLGLLAGGRAAPTEQDHAGATLAPRLKKTDGVIDWSAGAQAVCRLVRGTWPWPGAQAVLHRRFGPEVAVTIAAATPEPADGTLVPGEIDAELVVAAGDGRVRVGEIQPAGKRRMTWRDFVNGYRIQPGDGFRRPQET